MQRDIIDSQLSNVNTNLMYQRQLLTLAENVFDFKKLPEIIDVSYLNRKLLRDGRVAFFYDDVLCSVVALPFHESIGKDIYGRPLKIRAYTENNIFYDLKPGEFVIMYDNNGRYPLYLDILQYAARLALCERTSDVNIAQQKTPRFWKTKQENLESVKAVLNKVDAYENKILTYDNIDLDDTTLNLAPAPYVTDMIDIHKEKIWNEFLRLIGVANMNFQKKERNIKDEVMASQGGTVASRYSRFEPRQRAIEEINKKWGLDIEVSYYDGMPTTNENDNIDEGDEFDDDESIL